MPKKYVLDSKVSENMKAMIREKYHLAMGVMLP